MGCFGDQKGRHSQHFFATIILLDGSQLVQEVQDSSRGQQLLDLVFKHLDILETAYFGLRFVDSTNQTRWLDSRSKVMKQMKDCKDHNLYFGVKFYAIDPCKLVEEITRYQFFLQIKQDILHSRLPVTFDVAAELLAFLAQSELGDFDPMSHGEGYLSELKLLPKQSRELEERASKFHHGLIGRVPAAAELLFLDRVKWLDLYGADLHPVLGEDSSDYFIALTPSGVIVLKNKSKVSSYLWTRISKIKKKGKYFMLKVMEKSGEEKTYGFELPTIEACQHLWITSLDHQSFFGKSGLAQQSFAKHVTRRGPVVVRVPSIRRPVKEREVIPVERVEECERSEEKSKSWDEVSSRRRSSRSSDIESEVSRRSRHSSGSRHHRCRHRNGHDSGSESESGSTRRRRRRRSCTRSSYGTLIDSDQLMRETGHGESREARAVVRDLPSLSYHPVSTAHRRQLIPHQIKQFLEFDLVDPSEKEIIPYTQIESESQLHVRYSPTSGKAKGRTVIAKDTGYNDHTSIYANLIDSLDQFPKKPESFSSSITDRSTTGAPISHSTTGVLVGDNITGVPIGDSIIGVQIGHGSAGSRAPLYGSAFELGNQLKSTGNEMATEL